MKSVQRIWRLLRLLHFATPLLICIAAGSRQGWSEPATGFCAAEDGGGGTVVEVVNAETLLLDDARAVRLVGALPPRFASQYVSHGGVALDVRPQLKAALARLALGRQVRLRFGGAREDRYGKVLAQVYVEQNGEEKWLQGAVVGAGLSVAYSFADNRACARELAEIERGARERQEGFWRNGLFRVRAASDPKLLMGLAGAYQIVEGETTTVADRGGRVYINFGADYRNDFTVSIEKKDRSAFSGAPGGLAAIAGTGRQQEALDALKGKRLRVRGWIEISNGPMIAVTHPEQIETVANPSKEHH